MSAQAGFLEIRPLLVEALRIIDAQAALEANMNQPEVASVIVPMKDPPLHPGNDAGFAFHDYGAFYDFLRDNDMLGPKISESEFNGCDAIIKACALANWPISYTAYALGTAYLETGMTMQPVKERGGHDYYHGMYDIQGRRPAKARELGNLSPGDGAKYCGRGYVQLTGKANYAKATKKLQALGVNVDLVKNPDRAMEPAIAAMIMVYGMVEGWFTGRKLPDDLPARGPAGLLAFKKSRDIINGTDKDDEIAGFANDFQTGLQQGRYKIAA